MAETRSLPYGDERWSSGTAQTDFGFTGQRKDGFGLMDYNARFYSPLLGRFVSADTIVPYPYDPQSWDRFAYVRNNPISRVDPSGHMDDPFGGGGGFESDDDSLIDWDPVTDPGISEEDRKLAEDAFVHALEDPNYFLNLYFNTDSTLWTYSDEVAYLEIYLQYSTLHMNAEEFILFGYDILSARMARLCYNAGKTNEGNQFLLAAVMISAPGGALVPIPDGWVGRIADNGRGIIFQQPGATNNAYAIRIMDSTSNPSYPYGYVRYYNSYGQPLNPITGKPGSASETHIPINYNGPLNGWPK